ncbi:MAG: DUF4012 domain-containing protein [Patescibacteria group bacterium]
MFKTENFQEPEDIFHRAEEFLKEEKPPEQKKKKITFFFAILLLLIISSPLIFLGFNLFSSFLGFGEIQKAIQTQDLTKLKTHSKSLQGSLGRTLKFLEVSNPAFSLFGLEEKVSKSQNFFLFGKSFAESLYQIANIAQEGEKVFKKVLSGEDFSLEESLLNIKFSLEEAYQKTSLSQGLLNEFSGKEFLVGPYILKAKTALPQMRRTLIIAKEVIEIIPEILGIKERKTYLVLFQNNMEIRPSGGFIGSFGLLTLERGRLLDFEIQDVYFADGQLKGHVEPPPKLKEFLGTAGWYLRDSNWDPDFPTSAQRAKWFLDKEIGRTVDGVVGINLTVAQRILESIGEIELPDYQEKINSKNFFERAEYYSEAGFFPGSTGKQDFLGQVGRVLFEKIKTADEKTLFKVTQAFFTSLEEKDMMVFLDEPQVALLLAKFNWDGGIKRAKCEAERAKCLEDYLMVVEANVGVNKSNYFLKRSLEQSIKIGEEGKISERLVINYENQSPSEIFPAGRYKTYLRIYVPEDSLVDSLSIKNLFTNEEVGSGKWEVEEEHQRTVFGFLVEVPVGERRKVEISYTLPETESWEEYILFVQKQSGSQKDNFALSITYPQGWILREIQPPALTGEGLIIYNTTLSSDLIVRADFIKK